MLRHIAGFHLKVKNASCDLCSFKAFDERSLKRHMVVHDPAKVFKCTMCKRKYRNNDTLIAHIKTHESNRKVYSIVPLAVKE